MIYKILLSLLSLSLCSSLYAEQNDSIISADSISQDSISSEIIDSIENNTQYLDNFDYTLDKLIHDWYVENNLQIKCNQDSSKKTILFPDSVYIKRLQMLPYRMEMPFNSIVKTYIERYAKRYKQVPNMLGLGEYYYFPIFEEALAKYNVPLELKYLPIVESALNARAISPMGASGLWQFMPRTGKIYGLEINSMVDERRDPLKSSEAAAKYMSALYKIYGDWHLVIAAYNCGSGNVAKAIRNAGGKKGYWDIYPYLPSETRAYVPLFIAACYIMNYYEEHNLCPAEPITKSLTDTVMISDRVHLKQIADVIGMSIEELKFFNPQYRYDIIPGEYKQYPLALPIDKINKYHNNRDSILAYMPELAKRQVKVNPAGYGYYGSGKLIIHKVKDGDYLGKIANQYKVKVSQIKRWNNMRSTMIRVGQKIKIYK